MRVNVEKKKIKVMVMLWEGAATKVEVEINGEIIEIVRYFKH